jgi:hypothetical protein
VAKNYGGQTDPYWMNEGRGQARDLVIFVGPVSGMAARATRLLN